MKARKTYSMVLAATSDVSLCDGTPLTRYSLQPLEHNFASDLVEEEYESIVTADPAVMQLAKGVVEMESDESPEDSEDSNSEGHPWNEYPEEPWEKASWDTGFSSEREDYEDYASDSDW
jgi:hypothetical protein